MKKLFLFAAAALALTACTSEDDLTQSTAKKTVAQDLAVGFDIYTPAATNVTRAGLEGTMTTSRLQRSEANGGGFGVYAFLTEDTDGDAGDGANATAYDGGAPNFMVNEKILWNSTNLGWYYNPLKYWPNETDEDSQEAPAYMQENTDGNHHLDRLTFFAYAPYVAADDAPGTGIIRITDKTGKLNSTAVTDPTIEWNATTNVADFDPNEGVDLLWGVAPSGGLSYTAVNGWTVTRNEGTPLLNMIKPDVNTSMKFLFQHSLARFGVNVVAAIDQVAPGGKLDPNTKITIQSFKITGPFGTTGELNLNNDGHPNVANWTKVNSTDVEDGTKNNSTPSAITVVAKGASKNAIAGNLGFVGNHATPAEQPVVGVTTAKQDLLAPSTKWFKKLAAAPAYNPGKKYYSDEGTTEAHAKLANGTKAQIDGKWGFYYTESGGVYTKQSADDPTPNYPNLPSTKFYFVKATAHTLDGTDASSLGKLYKIDDDANDGSVEAKAPIYSYYDTSGFDASAWTAENGKTYYTLEAVQVPYTDLPYAYDPVGPTVSYYEAERNYLYVVPTNNFIAVNTSTPLTENEEKALRTITVQIEYYITTTDNKLGAGFAQTKNVITKEVVLPSLANGKTYMLNAVLGLTSVKIEAEVDDWKVVNSQVDLPQNTAE